MTPQYDCPHSLCRSLRRTQKRWICVEHPDNLRFLSTSSGKKFSPERRYWNSNHRALSMMATSHADLWLRYYPGRKAFLGVPLNCNEFNWSKKASYVCHVYIVQNVSREDLHMVVEGVDLSKSPFDLRVIHRYRDIDYFRTVQAFFQDYYRRDPAFTREYLRSLSPTMFLQEKHRPTASEGAMGRCQENRQEMPRRIERDEL